MELCLKDHVATRCKPGAATNDHMSIDCHILPVPGSRALTDVAPEDATGLHHGWRDTPAAANQALRMRY